MGHWDAPFFFVDFSSLGNRCQIWIGPYSVVDSVPISHCEKGLPLDVRFVCVIKEQQQSLHTDPHV